MRLRKPRRFRERITGYTESVRRSPVSPETETGTMSKRPREQLALRPETAERIRRAAQNRGLDVDQFLRQLIAEEGESPGRSLGGAEESYSFLDDWHPPTSLRDWIGLARPESSDATSDDRDVRAQRIHEKHVDR